MKTIDSYITEKLKINKDIVSKGPAYKYHPKSKRELHIIIKDLLKERGEDANLNDIDTSKVTDMEYLFTTLDPHNIDISEWDVSNVINMTGMFFECQNFNSDLSEWNVSKVEDMYSMFYRCKKFNCDLSSWNVSSGTDMEDMFYECASLKNIPSWYKK